MRAWLFSLVPMVAGCATMTPPPAPTAQVGIAFTRDGEIASFAEGLADPRTGRAVTPDDPVRVASVSKLVVAAGVLKLVEQGKLDLDGDVSRWLGWNLRNPAFPDRPVSLRQLLSHTGSVRDHEERYLVKLGQRMQDVLAEPTSWDARHGPGDGYFHYSNLNYGIVGTIIERVTGERFDHWMRREMLAPMQLDACFNWPSCSPDAVARAVVLVRPGQPSADDLQGRQPDCPVFVLDGVSCDLSRIRIGENGALFSPQGGLRISARGLARVGRMLLGGGTIDGVRILAPASVETLLTQLWRYDGANGVTDHGLYCSYGLGTQQIPIRHAGCGDDPGTRGATFVGHAGDAYGARSGLWIDRLAGTGIAYFVTGLPADPPRGKGTAFRAAEQRMFRRTLGLIAP